MFLSGLGYSELVQRLFEKMTLFHVDPLSLVDVLILYIFFVSYVGIDRLRVKMMSNGTSPLTPHDAIAIDTQP